MQPIDLICGVCGGQHPVLPRSGACTCPRRNRPYRLRFARAVSLAIRASQDPGRRVVELRVTFDDSDAGPSDQLFEWAIRAGDQVLVEPDDEIVLATYMQRVTGLHNLTLRRGQAFRLPRPPWITAALLGALPGASLMAMLVRSAVAGVA